MLILASIICTYSTLPLYGVSHGWDIFAVDLQNRHDHKQDFFLWVRERYKPTSSKKSDLPQRV